MNLSYAAVGMGQQCRRRDAILPRTATRALEPEISETVADLGRQRGLRLQHIHCRASQGFHSAHLVSSLAPTCSTTAPSRTRASTYLVFLAGMRN